MVTSVIEFVFATHVVQDYDANPKFVEKKNGLTQTIWKNNTMMQPHDSNTINIKTSLRFNCLTQTLLLLFQP